MSVDASTPSLDEMVMIDGASIHVRIDRGTIGRPLLILNGLTGGLEGWDPLVAALGDRTVIRFDPPGIGQSPLRLFPMTIRALAELATQILDTFDVAVADLFGYSHGGAVAQELAHRHPERVSSLILAATSCGLGSDLGVRGLLSAMVRAPKATSPTDAVSEPIAVLYRSLAYASWTSIPFLGSLPHSTLIVSGSRDRLVPAMNARVLADRIPRARAAEIAAGHDLQSPSCARDLATVAGGFLEAHDDVTPPGAAS
jgi:pimeloyl-ACP methyl ester carboxylesterase